MMGITIPAEIFYYIFPMGVFSRAIRSDVVTGKKRKEEKKKKKENTYSPNFVSPFSSFLDEIC